MSRTACFTLTILVRTLEDGLLLGEALFFPEVSRLATSRERLRDGLRETVRELVPHLPAGQVHARRGPSSVDVASVTVPLPPMAERGTWREPLLLRFEVAHFASPGQDAALAFVPALGIEIVGHDRKQVDELLPGEILAELMRRRATLSLPSLVMLQRDVGLEVEGTSLALSLPTLKERARCRASVPERRKTLPRVASELNARPLPPAYTVDPAPLAHALQSTAGRSVLLVGPSGVGKTAMLYELVRTRSAHGMAATSFWETSGARIMAGGSGFGAWQECCQEMWREAVATRSVLCLGNLVELMEVGRHESSPQGVAGFLAPFLARDEIPVVVECTPEQRVLLERTDPRLLHGFRPLVVESPTPDRTQVILAQAAEEAIRGTATAVDADAVTTVARLHHRFATYSSPPGRGLRFLRNLVHDAVDGNQAHVTARDAAAAFGHETGLPAFLVDPGLPMDVDAARTWFADRLVGQPEPIGLVVDALAAVKASLTRPRRPVCSFVFIGPTGVGKTEMARCLAEYLFRDRNRLVRFDMSEYADAFAVQRLIGTHGSSEGLLTAAVREQPFCVLLLDEVEKAHPLFFDLLLQVLGEARLTDAAGRLADFRNAVIVMTSNLGAASHQRAPLGFVSSAERGRSPREAARLHFVAEMRAHLRPELFNRIDRIVPFAPLDEETVLVLAERELESLQQRDGVLYREVCLEVDDGVAAHLAARGFDLRYGARPLKRAVEREVLAPLAAGLNRYGNDVPLRARVRLDGPRLEVEVRPRQGPDALLRRRDTRLLGLVTRLGDARTRAFRLARCAALLELQSDLYRLEQPRRGWQSAEDAARDDQRRKKLRTVVAEVEKVCADHAQAEDEAMLALHAGGAFDAPALAATTDALELRLRLASLEVYAEQAHPPRMVVAIYASPLEAAYALAFVYLRRIAQWQAKCRVAAIVTRREKDPAGDVQAENEPDVSSQKRGPSEKGGRRKGKASPKDSPQDASNAPEPPTERDWSKVFLHDPWQFMTQERADILGMVLEIEAPQAMALLEPEGGQHVAVHERQRTHRCRVVVESTSLEEYVPPPQVTRRRVAEQEAKRRTVLLHEGTVDDSVVGRIQGSDLELEEAMNACLDATLDRRVDEMLEGATRE